MLLLKLKAALSWLRANSYYVLAGTGGLITAAIAWRLKSKKIVHLQTDLKLAETRTKLIGLETKASMLEEKERDLAKADKVVEDDIAKVKAAVDTNKQDIERLSNDEVAEEFNKMYK